MKKLKNGIKRFFKFIGKHIKVIGFTVSLWMWIYLMLLTLKGTIQPTKYEIAGVIFLVIVYQFILLGELVSKAKKDKEEPVLQIVIKNDSKGE